MKTLNFKVLGCAAVCALLTIARAQPADDAQAVPPPDNGAPSPGASAPGSEAPPVSPKPQLEERRHPWVSVPDGAETSSTIAFGDSSDPGAPGHDSFESLTS